MDEVTELPTVVAANDVEGIEMGILSDGATYMTGRAVARLCGTAVSTIINQKDEWAAGKRTNKFAKKLLGDGYAAEELCFPVKHKGVNALGYPEAVVMAFLDYYAYDTPTPSEHARKNLRLLAKAGLRIFVYAALGYDPARAVPGVWREFHDRLLLATCPVGFFSIFMESSSFVLNAIRGGLRVDQHSVPDISLGKMWSNYWDKNDLSATHGERIRHEHNYPDYYAQAASNPQYPWVYPVAAIGEFRVWLQREYAVRHFPKYLESKVAKGMLPPSVAQLLIEASAPVEPKALPAPPSE
jgi:hypothetical protein